MYNIYIYIYILKHSPPYQWMHIVLRNVIDIFKGDISILSSDLP